MTHARLHLLPLAPLLVAGLHAQDPAAVHCAVHSRDEALPARLGREQARWFDPAQVERFVVEGVPAPPAGSVEALSDDGRWAFTFGDGVWRLEPERGLRETWTRAGKVVVEVRQEGRPRVTFAGVAIPDRLDLERQGAELTLLQREGAELPGSSGYYRVAIDDITGGQTLLELRGARGETPIARRSVRAGEALRFKVGAQEYVLAVRRLRNLLIGDDYAVLAVVLAADHERSRIDALLARIAAADVTFEREGRDYTPAEAVDHLRTKLHAAAAADMTLGKFVKEIASRSSLTGRPYHVRTADGVRREAEAWLREQIEALDQERQAAATRPSDR